MIERKELKTLVIDIKNNIYLLNGQRMNGVSKLNATFDNGKWSLLITVDELYEQATTEKTKGGIPCQRKQRK